MNKLTPADFTIPELFDMTMDGIDYETILIYKHGGDCEGISDDQMAEIEQTRFDNFTRAFGREPDANSELPFERGLYEAVKIKTFRTTDRVFYPDGATPTQKALEDAYLPGLHKLNCMFDTNFTISVDYGYYSYPTMIWATEHADEVALLHQITDRLNNTDEYWDQFISMFGDTWEALYCASQDMDMNNDSMHVDTWEGGAVSLREVIDHDCKTLGWDILTDKEFDEHFNWERKSTETT